MSPRCQTYEGGFGGTPCTEAHGGYTFCCVSALKLLDSLQECDLDALEVGAETRVKSRSGCTTGRPRWRAATTGGRTSWWTAATPGTWGRRSPR